jgi:hypothetical protein
MLRQGVEARARRRPEPGGGAASYVEPHLALRQTSRPFSSGTHQVRNSHQSEDRDGSLPSPSRPPCLVAADKAIRITTMHCVWQQVT